MGTWPDRAPKEFWWEREWRRRGSIDLTPVWTKIIWLCPEEERDQVAASIRQQTPAAYQNHEPVCIDPNWGLEQIIARLAGFPTEDVTLFHASAGDPDAQQEPPAF